MIIEFTLDPNNIDFEQVVLFYTIGEKNDLIQ